jgi:hypothetical protein
MKVVSVELVPDVHRVSCHAVKPLVSCHSNCRTGLVVAAKADAAVTATAADITLLISLFITIPNSIVQNIGSRIRKIQQFLIFYADTMPSA